MKLEKGLSGFYLLYREYKRDAKRRGHSFKLTKEEFITLAKQDCYYCGAAPEIRRKQFYNNRWIPPFNGIDRYSNGGGYYKENCVPCCKKCNRMKGQLDPLEFLEKIGQIARFKLAL